MECQDTNSFWKWWRSLYGSSSSKCASVIEGQSSKEGIANVFKDTFKKNSQPNNQSKVDEINSQFSEKYAQFSDMHKENCDCASDTITLDATIDAVFGMKQGKCPDDDGIHAEHIQNGPLLLFIKLSSLFNYMLSHAFVPQQFRFGSIIPIIKDKNGSVSDANNYRGITISPMISKAFEHVLKDKYSDHLATSSYQFGFMHCFVSERQLIIMLIMEAASFALIWMPQRHLTVLCTAASSPNWLTGTHLKSSLTFWWHGRMVCSAE